MATAPQIMAKDGSGQLVKDSKSQQDAPTEALLTVSGLSVAFGDASAVSNVSLKIFPGEVLGVAGQSGSGKSMTALAVMGLLPDEAEVSGSITLGGKELLTMKESGRAALRGRKMTMIFQETITALNPVITIGRQLLLAIKANTGCSTSDAREKARESLESVRMRDIDRVLGSYPHELSGGMCQRVMIAMALGCGAELLFADEPTTALDVTVQREILELVKDIVKQRHLSVMFISHDLGVLEEVADRLVIVKDGEVVEEGQTQQVMADPQHPYTQALLYSVPRIEGELVEFPEPPELVSGAQPAAAVDRPKRRFGLLGGKR